MRDQRGAVWLAPGSSQAGASRLELEAPVALASHAQAEAERIIRGAIGKNAARPVSHIRARRTGGPPLHRRRRLHSGNAAWMWSATGHSAEAVLGAPVSSSASAAWRLGGGRRSFAPSSVRCSSDSSSWKERKSRRSWNPESTPAASSSVTSLRGTRPPRLPVPPARVPCGGPSGRSPRP